MESGDLETDLQATTPQYATQNQVDILWISEGFHNACIQSCAEQETQ